MGGRRGVRYFPKGRSRGRGKRGGHGCRHDSPRCRAAGDARARVGVVRGRRMRRVVWRRVVSGGPRRHVVHGVRRRHGMAGHRLHRVHGAQMQLRWFAQHESEPAAHDQRGGAEPPGTTHERQSKRAASLRHWYQLLLVAWVAAGVDQEARRPYCGPHASVVTPPAVRARLRSMVCRGRGGCAHCARLPDARRTHGGADGWHGPHDVARPAAGEFRSGADGPFAPSVHMPWLLLWCVNGGAARLARRHSRVGVRAPGGARAARSDGDGWQGRARAPLRDGATSHARLTNWRQRAARSACGLCVLVHTFCVHTMPPFEVAL
jgi:hypothetical protein